MMKYIITVLFVFLQITLLFSQNGFIRGTLSDQTTSDKIPFAAAVALPADESPSKGTTSNGDGQFVIEHLKHGTYRLVVSFIGYQTDTINGIEITRDNHQIDLGNLALRPANFQLGEVQVQANAVTSTNKIDRQTFRASDFETARGGTAADVLSKLPSVSVDPEGNVSVRGTTDFMVYLNGKPTQMEPSVLLGQIAGSQIENIEIISVPTARFDSQGKGGIINITTKRTGADGLSVSMNGLGGGAPWGHVTDPYSGFENNDNRYGGGINLLYFKNKISLYGNLNFNHRNVNGDRTGDARILVRDNIYRHMIAEGERPEWYEYLSTNAGFDYRLTDRSTLSGSYFYGTRTEGRSAFYLYNDFYADKNKMNIPDVNRREEWIYNPNTDDRYGKFHSANVDFSQSFDDKSELKISGLYEFSGLTRELSNENYRYDRINNKVSTKLLQYRQTDDTPLDGYRLSVDYSKPLANGSKLGMGFQPQYLKIAGAFDFDTIDVKTGRLLPYTALENEVSMSRGVYAGYVDYTGSTGKLNYILGLRAELMDQEIEIPTADYFSLFDGAKESSYETNRLDLFHTLHFSYSLSEKEKLNFATSRRISRPPVKNMAPFLYRRHLEVYEVGDPELEPEYILNGELSYDRKINRHSVTLIGFYRGVENAVFRVNTITNENPAVMAVTKEEVLIRSYTNAGNSHSTGAELNVNLDAGKTGKFFIGGSLFNYRVKGDIFGYYVDNSSTNWSLKANANLNITRTLRFGADFNLKSATVTAQGKNDMLYLANTALTYVPPKLKGWDFSLRVLDVLGTNVEGLDTQAFNKNGQEIFYQTTDYYRTGGIVELGISYSFNTNGKSGKRVDSTFGKEQF